MQFRFNIMLRTASGDREYQYEIRRDLYLDEKRDHEETRNSKEWWQRHSEQLSQDLADLREEVNRLKVASAESTDSI